MWFQVSYKEMKHSRSHATFLDLNNTIGNGKIPIKLYDKGDNLIIFLKAHEDHLLVFQKYYVLNRDISRTFQ